MTIKWTEVLKGKIISDMLSPKGLSSESKDKIELKIIGFDLASGPDQTVIAAVQSGNYTAKIISPEHEYKEFNSWGGVSQKVITKINPPVLEVELGPQYLMSKLNSDYFIHKLKDQPPLVDLIGGMVTEICTADNPKPPGKSKYLWEHPDKSEHLNKFECDFRYYCKHCHSGAKMPMELKEGANPREYNQLVDGLISLGDEGHYGPDY